MEAIRAAGALGAWVDVDLGQVARSAALADELAEALVRHEVLFARDQALAPDELKRLAERFGEIEPHPAYPTVAEVPGVQILESTAAAPTKIEAWHSDMTFRAQPPGVTLLLAETVPAFGGDTLWASASAAYEGLSASMCNLVDGLAASHDFAAGFKESLAEPGGWERLRSALVENPPVSHPVVRTHPASGRKAIYVNSLFTTRIDGVPPRESEALLAFLASEVATVEYTVRLAWRPGTVAIWDNRTTQHKPVNDYFPQHRRMYRVTVAGERPR